jgi:hypothetical protein
MVKVCAAEPTTTVDGEMDVTVGAGLFTVKLTADDAPPPGVGLVTTTGKVPAAAWSVALNDIVRSVVLT